MFLKLYKVLSLFLLYNLAVISCYSQSNELNSLNTSIFNFQETYTINDGVHKSVVLGDISDGVLGANAQAFLLDRSASKVYQLDDEGKLIQEYGREGRGPGEFLEGFSIGLNDTENELFVLDYRNARVVSYNTNDGSYKSAINLNSTYVTRLNQLDVFENELLLLGFHQNKNTLVHVLDPDGSTVKSFGALIDFDNIIHTNMGKIQLSQVHTSSLNGNLLVGLAAPHRTTLYNREFEPINTLEDDLLPVPWETHMTMTPETYKVDYYPMAIENQLLSDEHYLLVWVNFESDKNNETISEYFLELRELHTGGLLHRVSLQERKVLEIKRINNQLAYLLIRTRDYQYKVVKLEINLDGF
ncbi:6-bladed beta-propeller [Rhodohalobacter sulfatireducens]|uniref:6-bladed beta-propeller n=1 Tax=Rhodohalobacter sulfatireducens TaxID=2911366 RepID=A0ABS9KBL0_9BACT|nr:6-bladed beta-propeller [Rhodohalobacter sulfatireducens]MCG2588239.1 6-bladed beta-propeller [Rhodohalobacter sulfatireducens]